MAAHEQDDKLHLHMALERVNLQSRMLQKKNDGSMTCAMLDFEKKRRDKTIFFSPPFYTHPNGYSMALRVNANGSGAGEGTHVSVYACILEGEYDAGLKWPFVGDVTIALLNQIEDMNHRTMTMPLHANLGDHWGPVEFISQSELAHDPINNTQYLKDDTLYFKLTAEVTGRKPWLECNN